MVSFGGQAVITLLESIRANSRRFHRPPIGPVGSFLALEEDRWAYAVEQAIGGKIFNSFLVHDKHDSDPLKVSPRV